MVLRRSARRFELIVVTDGRPVIDGLFETLGAARERAAYLLSLGRYPLVRILQIDADERERCVFEEGPGQIRRVAGINPNIALTDNSPSSICCEVNDVYGLPSRLLLLRLLRAWWDERGVLPTETMHDALALRQLERTDAVFIPAIGQLAKIQAAGTGEPGGMFVVRLNTLTRLFSELRRLAVTAEADLAASSHALSQGGLSGLFAELAHHPAQEHQRRITFAFAMRLRPAADWNERLSLLLALRNQPNESFDRLLDGFIAETIDGAVPIREVIGTVPDLATALMRLAATLHGDLIPRSSESPGLQGLSVLLADCPEHFPHLKQALARCIAGGLNGRGTLTRFGGEAERAAFLPLVDRLVCHGGFFGGPELAAALTRRAKSALATRAGDLGFEMAVERLCRRLPSNEARAGYRLDLAASDYGGRFAIQLAKQAETDLNASHSDPKPPTDKAG